ncbi:MAG: hypothetical protein K6D57_01545 [Paludibacteraceae bacterium]|nr:hypothetical protein [Paludibacteraceae bacterium]
MNKKGCCRTSDKKLSVFDWLSDLPETVHDTDFVEVQFKNTRKGYYLNSTHIPLEKGDTVAVEASPGHDIGEVTLVGRLVLMQMQKNRIDFEKFEIKRVYRKARATDLEKWKESKSLEQQTMIRSRQIAEELGLNMKIGDVEYQGDGNKAIFYYIAESRVDFRQLIKVLADNFHVRIEMRQIGARQEAGRIGGIGPCGRELCCASWMSNFVSVSTSAARHQDISLNPQKLAGQCAKLKCCINYEAATYADAVKDFPPKDIPLETIDGTWYHFKTDVFKREMTYSSDKRMAANLVVLSVDRVKEIIALNKQGNKPEQLVIEVKDNTPPPPDFQNVVGQDSLTRFDKNNKREKKRGGKDRHERSRDRHADRRNRSGNGQKPEKKQTNPSQPSTNPSNA